MARKADQKEVEALFGRAVEVRRSPAMQQLETQIEREAARRGRYERSVRRRVRHGIMPQDELDLFREEKARLARELETVR
jgi:hypothetical protein